MPPIGASTEAYVAAYPSLTFTVPARIRAAIRRPRATSRVHTEAFRPYGVLLASRTASCSSTNGYTDTTGPNVSSPWQAIRPFRNRYVDDAAITEHEQRWTVRTAPNTA